MRKPDAVIPEPAVRLLACALLSGTFYRWHLRASGEASGFSYNGVYRDGSRGLMYQQLSPVLYPGTHPPRAEGESDDGHPPRRTPV